MYLRKNVVLYKRKCFSKQKFRDNFLIYLELEDEFKSHRRHTFILRKFYLPFFLIAFATQQQYNSIVTFHHNHLLIRLDFGLLEFSHVFLISFNHFFFYYSSFSLSLIHSTHAVLFWIPSQYSKAWASFKCSNEWMLRDKKCSVIFVCRFTLNIVCLISRNDHTVRELFIAAIYKNDLV